MLNDDELKIVYRKALETPYPFGPIVQLLILTGQRRGEIAALRWDWLDVEGRTITLPVSVTKNKRSHTFPYGDSVQQLLDGVPRLAELLFPAAREHVRGVPTTTFNGWGKALKPSEKSVPSITSRFTIFGAPLAPDSPHSV